MGACYSKTGHGAESPRDRLPYEKAKPKRSSKNGHASHVAYIPVKSVEEGSDIKNDRTLKEGLEDLNQNTESGQSQDSPIEIQNTSTNKDLTLNLNVTSTNGVVQSDSGIVVESSNLDSSNSHDVCTLPNHVTQVERNVAELVRTPSSEISTCFYSETQDTECSSVHSSNHIAQSSHVRTRARFRKSDTHSEEDLLDGECQSYLSTSYQNRSSDSILKSSLKQGNRPRKKHRLSWKSADSLDWTASMTTCMDRTKSEASSIFADDISLNAPLATFDSIDFAIGSSYNFPKSLRTNSCIEYSSDTFNFKFDFSGLEGASNVASDRKDSRQESASNRVSSDLDKIKVALSAASTPTAEMRSFCESETSYELPAPLASLVTGDVTTVMVGDREMVMIDAEMYNQILEELAFLKMELSKLTAVIQDDVRFSQDDDFSNRETTEETNSSNSADKT